MATEKRLIRADVTVEAFSEWLTSLYDGRMPADIVDEIPTVDAVPVDEIIFHHILIDKDGTPEVKLQFGERTLILRKTDPVDVVEVVRCKDCKHMEMTPDGLRWCNVWNGINGLGDEGFCNYGERRTDGR